MTLLAILSWLRFEIAIVGMGYVVFGWRGALTALFLREAVALALRLILP